MASFSRPGNRNLLPHIQPSLARLSVRSLISIVRPAQKQKVAVVTIGSLMYINHVPCTGPFDFLEARLP